VPDDNDPWRFLTVQSLGHIVHEPLVHSAVGIEGDVVGQKHRVDQAVVERAAGKNMIQLLKYERVEVS